MEQLNKTIEFKINKTFLFHLRKSSSLIFLFNNTIEHDSSVPCCTMPIFFVDYHTCTYAGTVHGILESPRGRLFFRSDFRSAQISVQGKVPFFSDFNNKYRSKAICFYIFRFRNIRIIQQTRAYFYFIFYIFLRWYNGYFFDDRIFFLYLFGIILNIRSLTVHVPRNSLTLKITGR